MTSVFSSEESVTIENVWEKLGDKARFKILNGEKDGAGLLCACAKSRRFKDIRIEEYVDDTSIEENKQFAAMTFRIDDKRAVAVFRGTDDTIVGWTETL